MVWGGHCLPEKVRAIGPITVVCLILFNILSTAAIASNTNPPNIHAVLVASSRYWFNYRHAMNALGLYRILKENGVPDSQIVLMIADEYATNPRNPYKNGMYANGIKPADTWYDEETELDYRGSDVTVQNFVNAVLGTGPKSLQDTNENSTLLIFVTGHGGDQFFKFQDEEELTAQDIANMMDELSLRRKFKKALFIADTCQAFTLFDKVTTPNVYALGTSLRNENAYAHHADQKLGVSVIERWTYGFLNQYRKRNIHPATTTLQELMVDPFHGKAPLGAHVGVLGDFRDVLLSDFFGSKMKSPQKPRQARASTQKLETLSFQPIYPVGSIVGIVEQDVPLKAYNDIVESHKIAAQNLEPDDSSFLSMVAALAVVIVLTSQFGKRRESDETK